MSLVDARHSVPPALSGDGCGPRPALPRSPGGAGRGPSPSAWSAAEDAELRRLFADGMSAGDTARIMGNRTRNAIIGRWRRLGLQRGHRWMTADIVEKVRVARAAKPRPVIAKPPRLAPRALDPVEDVQATLAGWPKPRTATAVTLFGLTMRTCRMPLFEGHEPIERKFYCGAPCEPDVAYCPACAALAHQPRQPGKVAA